MFSTNALIRELQFLASEVLVFLYWQNQVGTIKQYKTCQRACWGFVKKLATNARHTPAHQNISLDKMISKAFNKPS